MQSDKVENKELVKLVERLKRIFPHLKMDNELHYIYDEPDMKGQTESNFCAPFEWDWFGIIEELRKNGLDIKSK